MVESMIAAKRRDPTAIFTSPIPLRYDLLGGDVQKLIPMDIMKQAKEDLLAQAGVPVEFYRGTLQLQVAPVALRLFQATNSQLVGEANRCVRWIVDRLSSILGWEKVKPRLKPVGVADDIQRQAMLLQLMMSGKMSTTDALSALGISYARQRRMLRDEQIEDMEAQQEVQDAATQKGLSMQLAQGQLTGPGAAPGGAPGGAPGQMPPGGQAPTGAPGQVPGAPPTGYDPNDPVGSYLSMSSMAPSSVEDFSAQAESLAMQLKQLPEGMRRQQLSKLRTGKPQMHRQVMGQLASLRSQDRATGYNMLQQMQQGGQAPPSGGAPPPGGAPM
jgi:hypothetical protein